MIRQVGPFLESPFCTTLGDREVPQLTIRADVKLQMAIRSPPLTALTREAVSYDVFWMVHGRCLSDEVSRPRGDPQ